METDRRRFLSLALSAASAATLSGCVGENGNGDGNGDETDGPSASETAEFGYETWVPAGEYMNLGYADLTRLRNKGSLRMDTETASVVGEAGPQYADVDAYISTDSEDAFDAVYGSFDTGALTQEISDELAEPEQTERNAYTVVEGTKTEQGEPTDQTVEAVVSDTFVVSSSTDGVPTRVIDAAVGDADREADAEGDSELIAGLEEYTTDPFVVVFNYGSLNSKYRFVEERDGALTHVNVTVQRDEETARNVSIEQDPSRKYDDISDEEDNITTRVEGRNLIIIQEMSFRSIENFYFSEGGIFP
jgi:hypothetical protein